VTAGSRAGASSELVKGERRDSEKARVVRCGRLLLEETSPWGARSAVWGKGDVARAWQTCWQAGSESSSSNHQHAAVLYCTVRTQAPKYSTGQWALGTAIHHSFQRGPFLDPFPPRAGELPMIHPQADQVELSQPSPGETTSYEVALPGRGKAHDAPPLRATGEQESCMRVNLAGQWPRARWQWKAMECRRGTSEDC
jgi:hypothetical protein